MKKQLLETERQEHFQEREEQTAGNQRTWLPLLGGILGGLIGLVILLIFRSFVFSRINLTIIAAIVGALYGWMCDKEKASIILGAIIGGLSVLHPISFGLFVFGGAFTAVYVFSYTRDIEYLGWLIYAVGIVIMLSTILTAADLLDKFIDRGSGIAILPFVLGRLLFLIPYLNILGACIAGGYWGYQLSSSNILTDWLSVPYFVLPLLLFAGYFLSLKISEKGKPKEDIRKVPEGGLLMSEEPAFFKGTNPNISPVAFSEKAMINDLLAALNNKSLLSTKLASWKARAKGQDQLRAFEMIKEMLEKETDIIEAYTANQQARLDFENLKEFNQYLI